MAQGSGEWRLKSFATSTRVRAYWCRNWLHLTLAGMTPAGPGWTGPARLGGEALFRTRVMDAIGAGLFLHIEHAAGGLAGLSFRFVITDPVGCRKWPEGRRAKLDRKSRRPLPPLT